jgi:hypothetical protein
MRPEGSLLEKTAHSRLRGKAAIPDGAGQSVTPEAHPEKGKNSTHSSLSLTNNRSQSLDRAAKQRSLVVGDSPNSAVFADYLDDLTRVLTKHIGPLAKLIAKKKAATANSLSQLVSTLSLEIPRAQDRKAFISEARSITEKNPR